MRQTEWEHVNMFRHREVGAGVGKGSGKSSRHMAHESAVGGAVIGAWGNRVAALPHTSGGLQREASASALSFQLWRPG